MAAPDRFSSLLPATILAAALGVPAGHVPAGPPSAIDPIRVEFDSIGRVTRVDPGLGSQLGLDPSDRTPPNVDLLEAPDPVPVEGNKVNSLCTCRSPKQK